MSHFTHNANIPQPEKQAMYFFRNEVDLFLCLIFCCHQVNEHFTQSRREKRVPEQHNNRSGTDVTAQHNNGGPCGCLCVSPPRLTLLPFFFLHTPGV